MRGITGAGRPMPPLRRSHAERGNEGVERGNEVAKRIWVVLGLWLVLALMAASAQAQSTTTVEIYPCPTGQAAAISDRLRVEFGTFPASESLPTSGPRRSSCRPRRRSKHALASGSRPLRRQWERPSAGGASAGRTDCKHRPPRLRPARSICEIARPETLASALSNIFASRLEALPAEQLQARRYRLALAGGGSVEISVDLATADVTVAGPSPAVNTSIRLIRLLDSPTEAEGREVRLLPLRTAPPASIRHVAEVLRDTTGSPPPNPPLAVTLFQSRDAAALRRCRQHPLAQPGE